MEIGLQQEEGDLPSYASVPFSFELSVSKEEGIEWFEQNWTSSFTYILVYLLVLFRLSLLMRGSERFEFKNVLILWNLGLALFSVAGTIRMAPELFNILTESNGYHNSICEQRTFSSAVAYFWSWWFLMSKVVELGNTVFVVLRKRPLTFLHVYYHCSVLCVSWYLGSQGAPTARWFITMSLSVHSIMYAYYALQTARWVKIPKPFAMAITILQIAQMVLGLVLNIHAYRVKRRNEHCEHSDGAIHAAGVLYFSYLLLFVWFFYSSYLRKSKNKSS